jgi:hypothetical protein
MASAPFLGASAEWVDDGEVTYEHTKRRIADHLRERLVSRIALLDQVDLQTGDVTGELRRQMAECAVDGNLMLASDLGDATWDLLQHRESRDGL